MAKDDDDSRRIDRLARHAKELDDEIVSTTKMQKQIGEEIGRVGQKDKLTKQHVSATPKTRQRKKTRS